MLWGQVSLVSAERFQCHSSLEDYCESSSLGHRLYSSFIGMEYTLTTCLKNRHHLSFKDWAMDSRIGCIFSYHHFIVRDMAGLFKYPLEHA